MTKRSRDNAGNPMGHDHPNQILYSRQYVVEFEYGTEAELKSNAITQSMYAQFDPNGNKYPILDSIADFHHSTTALCYADQNFVNNVRT